MTDIGFGFIVLRHVNSTVTNKYWILCCECIRNQYPEAKILIIDDNSDPIYLTERSLYKTRVIRSEYPGRGELLPYYYYLHNKEFERAIIIHDSVFLNSKIDTDAVAYKMLWEFEHNWDQIDDETRMIKSFGDRSLYQFYKNKSLWKGCFGGMSIIKHDYLLFINKHYPIDKLLTQVLNRYNRCSFERVIACLLQKNTMMQRQTLFGNIHKYCRWGITFDDKDKYKHLPVVKVLSGR